MKNFKLIFGFLMISNFCSAQTNFLLVYPSGDAKYTTFNTKVADVSLMGDVLCVYSHLDEISLEGSNLTQGLYIILTYEDGKIISSKKHFLSHNNN